MASNWRKIAQSLVLFKDIKHRNHAFELEWVNFVTHNPLEHLHLLSVVGT